MRARLPLIGEIRTGSDLPKRGRPPKKMVVEEKLSTSQLGAGFLDLGDRALSGEKDVSTRLIKSFYSWVFANVSVLAEEISQIEFELYKVVMVKGDAEFQEVNQNPILDLLDRPNPFTTTSQLIYVTEAHLELTGDAFWLLDKSNQPTQIFTLQPDKVTLKIGDQEDGYKVTGYIFKDVIDGKAVETTYEPEVVIHFKTPNPGNPYRGKSVVEAASLSIDNSNLSREFLKMFFINGAVPNFALSSDQRITDDDIKRITAQLKRTYGGVHNAFKTMILGGGLKPVSVQQTGQQMQLLELLTAMRDEIMAMFKNTKASLGITDDVNRANAEASILSWKSSVIKPKMTRITDTINEFLIPKFGTNMVIGFCDPVPENRMDDINEVSAIMATSVRQTMTVNEARGLLDLDPLPDKEFDTIQASTPMVVASPTQDATPKALRNISLVKHMRANGIYEHIDLQKNIYSAAKDVAKLVVKKKVKGKEPFNYHNYSYEKAMAYWEKQIHITEIVEQNFENKINWFISELEEKAVKNLHLVVGKKVKKFELFDEEEEVQAGIDLFTPLTMEIAQLAATEAYTLLKLSTLYNPSKNLRHEVSIAVERFTKSFIHTDKEKLTDILTTGIQDGQSIPQIESAIREQFGQFRKSQTKTIARTEVLRASNSGQLDAYKASGVVEGKQWLTSPSPDECEQYNGQIVWDLDGSFYGKSEFADGDPPLHPNCRCIILPVLVSTASVSSRADKLEKELKMKEQYIEELEKLVELG